MAADDVRLDQLAADVLDGRAVDWKAAESSASAEELRFVEHLKVVAAVIGVYRIPDRWGHLQITERVGSGTFGEVYRAWDPHLDREVALKLLPAERQSRHRQTSAIIQEGRLLARVHHPNVVTIHGAEQIGDRIGMWMELVRGRTLEQCLAEGTHFSPHETVRIGADLCRAVEAVHTAGLIHRDIKAHNVMLADDGRVVLMDFGAGRELADRSASDLTGTPLYVAPEVLSGGQATIRSDIYSLGVLMFHILTGSYPVQGRDVGEIRTAHESRARVSLRAQRPDVPSRLARAIECALDPVADRRHQSAEAFSAALRHAIVGLTRRRLIYGAVAATAVLATGAAWRGRGSVASTTGAVVAVMTFENRDTGPGGEEFADGLSDEVQRSLAGIEGLTLRSTRSSFVFRDRPHNLRAIASQLGVDFVLDGSVSRSNDHLQVNARFVRVPDGIVIWTKQFERDVKSASTIIDDIAPAIAGELRVRLGRGRRRYDLDPDLYYQFLRARAFHGRRGPQNSAKAAELFALVVSNAPDYAPGWAGLASSLAQLSRPSDSEVIIPPDPRLRPAALTGLQLDPLLAEAHAAVGNLYASDRDWVNARMSFLKALALNPTLTETHNDFVLGVLMPLGDTSESLRQLAAAREVDPLSLDVRRTQAHIFVDVGRYSDAIENCRWIEQHDPAFPFVEVWLGRALYFSGQFEEAQQVLERAGPQFFGYLGYLLAVSGHREAARALAAKDSGASSRNMLIYAGLGDKDRAYDGLVRTAEVNWWRAATWMHRPEMALLREDPRMPALRKKLGLPK